MKKTETGFRDLVVLEPKIFKDNRGYFFESFNRNIFKELNLPVDFDQDNQSQSQFGTIRGLHYQIAPHSQAKLVRVLQGKIYDVAIDLRKGSPTYGKWYGIELSEDNMKQLYVPHGFAHGFSVLSETTTILYKCEGFYNSEAERGIMFNDEELGIEWQLETDDVILSTKDKVLPAFKDSEHNFKY